MMRWLFVFFLLGQFFLSSPSNADVFKDVPEAKNYKLLYSFDIPVRSPGFFAKLPNYRVDNSGSLSGSVSRIAYYLSLEGANQKRQFVYVSMDAFTQNLKHMGIPSGVRKVIFQQKVKRLNVVSNVAGIKNATGLRTGNIEFWPTNYSTNNALKIPGASEKVYDVGDARAQSGTYGSMQVHNHALGQTLFAYNSWGGANRICDLGIGNNAVKHSSGLLHKDWTFRGNCGSYTKRTLQVLVSLGKLPPGSSMKIKSPMPHQVVQRQKGNKAKVSVSGEMLTVPDSIEARVVSLKGGKTTPWRVIVANPSGKTFSGSLEVLSGWYRLDVRFMKSGKPLDTGEVEPFGVGEVFIIAGQSNSANSGRPALKAKDSRVTNSGITFWTPAQDPMHIATGGGGSPWPALGDILVDWWDVPIGILSVGWGGTSVTQWQPNHSKKLYPRLRSALQSVGKNGARAVLWHQGESDSAAGTTTANYTKLMNNVIAESRKDAGWDIPWYIAGVSYLPRASAAAMQAIRRAQKQVAASHPMNFEGPTTDDLVGAKWRYDRVHFNEAGLREHARRWSLVLKFPPCQGFPQKGDECLSQEEPPGEKTSSEPIQENTEDAGEDAGVAEPTVEPSADDDEPTTPQDETNKTPEQEPVVQDQPTQAPDVPEQTSKDKEEPQDASVAKDAGGTESGEPQDTVTTSGGCGCTTQSGGGVMWMLWVVLFCVLLRQRKGKLAS